MAGARIVASNDLLLDRATVTRVTFDTSHSLRLFKNNVNPQPQTTIAELTEAAFPGYAPLSMSGVWGPVFKAANGDYQFNASEQTFEATAANSEMIYGWFLEAFGRIQLLCLLPFPKSMPIGSPLKITVRCHVYAVAVVT